MIFDFGDVVVVPFPFTDQSASKRRPAAIISIAQYNRVRPDVVLMAVTSQVRIDEASLDVPVADWQEAGLLKPSAVKPVIATLEAGLVIRTLGHLSARDKGRLREALANIVGGRSA